MKKKKKIEKASFFFVWWVLHITEPHYCFDWAASSLADDFGHIWFIVFFLAFLLVQGARYKNNRYINKRKVKIIHQTKKIVFKKVFLLNLYIKKIYNQHCNER